jgi:hypothetical protein
LLIVLFYGSYHSGWGRRQFNTMVRDKLVRAEIPFISDKSPGN